MPFVQQTRSDLGQLGQPLQAKEEAVVPDIQTTDVIAAAFSIDNTLVSGVKAAGNGMFAVGDGLVDENYDPFDDIEGTPYQQFGTRFIETNNRSEADIVKKSIDDETEARRTVEQAGGIGIAATFAAALFDPINLIPMGVGVNAAIKGGSILKGAATAAAAGVLTETASEALLQGTQATRSLGESAINIAAGSLLAGALGAGATAIVKKRGRFKDLSDGVDRDMTIPPETEADDLDKLALEMVRGSAVAGNESIGAAKVVVTTLEQESLVGSLGIAKATAKLNPLLRLAHSPSKVSRELSQQLIENPVFFNKNIEGIATEPAVETLIKESNGRLAAATDFQRQTYKSYKRQLVKQGGKPVNFMEFKEQVAKSLRRNDTSDNPFAADVAKKYRSEVLNPLKKRAIENDLLPEDVSVTTAESYLMRIWDKEKIVQNEPEFRSVVGDWVRSQAKGAVAKFTRETNEQLSKLEAQLAKAKDKKAVRAKIDDLKIEREVESRTFFDTENNFDEYVESITDEIVRSLKGHDRIRPTYDVKIAERGPLKERVFNIPDDKVEKFLNNDTDQIAERYTRQLGTDVELQEKFGNLNMEAQLKQLDESYQELSDLAKTPKERTKLEKQRKSDKEDLMAMLEIMRGTSSKYTADPSNLWVRTGRQLRILQYLSKLGGVTVSSFADVARPAMVHGFGRSFSKGLLPAIKGSKGRKLSIIEAKKAGQVTERILAGRMATLAELADPYAQGTAFERFAQNLSNGFSKVTLMSQWNDFWKGTSSVITQDRMLGNIGDMVSGKALSKGETQYMAFLGIDKDIARQMSKEIKKFGATEDGIRIANTQNWENDKLVRTFRAALNKDVDRTIVTKGLGDIPLFANSETGKLLLQFRSFALAAHQRILIAGLQQSDAAFASGLVFAVSAGMVTYAAKTLEKGQKLSDDPGKWIVEGIDRSGIIPIIMEANNMAEKVGIPGITKLAGAPTASRYASRNMIGSFIGPTAGTVQDISTTTRAIMTGELSKSDVRAARRLMPYQNLIFFRNIMDIVEDAISKSVGAK